MARARRRGGVCVVAMEKIVCCLTPHPTLLSLPTFLLFAPFPFIIIIIIIRPFILFFFLVSCPATSFLFCCTQAKLQEKRSGDETKNNKNNSGSSCGVQHRNPTGWVLVLDSQEPGSTHREGEGEVYTVMYAHEAEKEGSMSPTFSIESLRTVGSVMHEPPRPPYRRLEKQQQQQQRGHRHKQLLSSDMRSSTTCTALHSTTSRRQVPSSRGRKKLLSPSSVAVLTNNEAEEAAKELQAFEEGLRTQHCHSSGEPGMGRHACSQLEGDVGGPSMEAASNVLQFSVVNLLPRLFSRVLLQHNKIVTHLQDMGREVVLQKLCNEGRRVGMRSVTARELYFLLSCVVDKQILREDDAKNLFRFFDWGTQGSIDFKEMLASVSLLFAPPEMLAVVHCRWLMEERPLDDSVILLADVDVMLKGLTSIFGGTLHEVAELCSGVREVLTEMMPMHTVPVPVFRAELNRFPLLKQCLAAVGSDGMVAWPVLLRLLSRPTPESGNMSRAERQLKLVSTAIAEGRGAQDEIGSECDAGCTVDICHPLFVADKYSERAGEA